MIPALEWFDVIKLKTAVTMYQTYSLYNNVLHVNLQAYFVRVEPVRISRHVDVFER